MIVFSSALYTPARVVELELILGVQQLYGGRVAIDVHHRPERTSCLHAAEEDSLLFSVDAKVDISRRRHVVEQNSVTLAEPLCQRFRPVACLVCQVCTEPNNQWFIMIIRQTLIYSKVGISFQISKSLKHYPWTDVY